MGLGVRAGLSGLQVSGLSGPAVWLSGCPGSGSGIKCARCPICLGFRCPGLLFAWPAGLCVLPGLSVCQARQAKGGRRLLLAEAAGGGGDGFRGRANDLRAAARAGWERRWRGQLGCALQRALASTLLGGCWRAAYRRRSHTARVGPGARRGGATLQVTLACLMRMSSPTLGPRMLLEKNI